MYRSFRDIRGCIKRQKAFSILFNCLLFVCLFFLFSCFSLTFFYRRNFDQVGNVFSPDSRENCLYMRARDNIYQNKIVERKCFVLRDNWQCTVNENHASSFSRFLIKAISSKLASFLDFFFSIQILLTFVHVVLLSANQISGCAYFTHI